MFRCINQTRQFSISMCLNVKPPKPVKVDLQMVLLESTVSGYTMQGKAELMKEFFKHHLQAISYL